MIDAESSSGCLAKSVKITDPIVDTINRIYRKGGNNMDFTVSMTNEIMIGFGKTDEDYRCDDYDMRR